MIGPLAWEPNPDVWLMAVVLLGGYFYLLDAWGPTHAPDGPPATRRQRVFFVLGVVVLWVASDWPIHAYEVLLLSVHMVQHLAYALIAAPLLIIGTPAWLLRKLLAPSPIMRTVRAVTRPFVAIAIFNGWILLYHAPAVLNLSNWNPLFHFATHVVWVVVSLIMWFPVLSPLPELPRLDYLPRMGYLFAQTLIPSMPASFFTFAGVSIYASYELAPRVTGLSAVADQQLAGMIMKIGAGAILWTVIGYLFFQWLGREEAREPRAQVRTAGAQTPDGRAAGTPIAGSRNGSDPGHEHDADESPLEARVSAALPVAAGERTSASRPPRRVGTNHE